MTSHVAKVRANTASCNPENASRCSDTTVFYDVVSADGSVTAGVSLDEAASRAGEGSLVRVTGHESWSFLRVA